MNLKDLIDAIVLALRSATSTHLANSGMRVYKGDLPGWRATKGIFVVWSGSSERSRGIGQEMFGDTHTINVYVRHPARDETGAIAPADWYDDFVELVQEVRKVFTPRTNRALADTYSNLAWKLELGELSVGFSDESGQEYWEAAQPLIYEVPQP